MRAAIIAGVLACMALALFWIAGPGRYRTASAGDRRPAASRPASSEALARQALAGSIPAAERMMEIYRCPEMGFRTKAEEKDCYSALEYWTAVALENGSPVAAQTKTTLLLYSDRCEDIYRAEYWVPRFKEAFPGHPDLASDTNAEIEQKKRTCTWSRTPAMPEPIH